MTADTENLVSLSGFHPTSDELRRGAEQGGSIRAVGVALETLGTTVSDAVGRAAGRWAGLSDVYQAPETDRVLGLVGPAVSTSQDVVEDLAGVKKALDGYADDLLAVADRLRTLELDIGDFHVEVGRVDTWQKKQGMIDTNADLVRRLAQVERDIQTAARDCASQMGRVVPEVEAWILQMAASWRPWSGGSVFTVSSVEALEAYDASQGWGAPRERAKGRAEAFVSHAWGTVKSFGTLVGYNPQTGHWGDGAAASTAWKGLGNVVGSVGVMAVYSAGVVSTGGVLFGVSFGDSVDGWLYERAEVVRDTGGSLVGYDARAAAAGGEGWWKWKQDAWGTAGEVTVLLGSMALPVKGFGAASDAARLGTAGTAVRVAAEAVVPAGSYAVHGAAVLGRGVAALPKGWSAAVGAVREAWGAGRGAVPGEAGAVGALAEAAPGSARVPSVVESFRAPASAEAVVPDAALASRPGGARAGTAGDGGLVPGVDQAGASRPVEAPGVRRGQEASSAQAGSGRQVEVPDEVNQAVDAWMSREVDSILYHDLSNHLAGDATGAADAAREPALVGAGEAARAGRVGDAGGVAGAGRATPSDALGAGTGSGRAGTDLGPVDSGPGRTGTSEAALADGPTVTGDGAGRGGSDGPSPVGHAGPPDDVGARPDDGRSYDTSDDQPGADATTDHSHLPPQAQEAIGRYEQMIDDELAKPDPEYWRINRWQGQIFNWENYHRYPTNEVYLDLSDPGTGTPLVDANGSPRRAILDSYTPGQEVVSRKRTQLGLVNESTAREYINQAVRLYGPNKPGITIADVPTTRAQLGHIPDAIGKPLDGNLILEVPVQRQPIPESILRYAALKRVTIRDVSGKVYELGEELP